MPRGLKGQEVAVAKGQKRSSREPKKPKKTAAELAKASRVEGNFQVTRIAGKTAPKK